MRTSMEKYRLHAAGGGLPVLTKVWLQFRFLPSMNEQTVPMP
jgi:hypothetical protein